MALAHMLVAVTASATAAADAGPPPPLRLEVARDPGWVIVRIVGQNPVPVRVHYALTVTGRSATRHAGRSVIGPSPATVSTIRFASDGDWRARLEVDGGSPAAYVIERSSDNP